MARPKGSSSVGVALPCGCCATVNPKTYWKVRRMPAGARLCLVHNRVFVLTWREVSFKDLGRIVEGANRGETKRRVVVRRPVSS